MNSRRRFLQYAAMAPLGTAQDFPDTIYRNGRIVTLDPANRIAAAVTVRSGKILAVGSEADARAAASRRARVVDLAGRTMLPGLFAAHDHLPQGGLIALFEVDLNSPPMGAIETMD